MTIGSLAALYSFFLLIAPGMVWTLWRSRHIPDTKETTLVEFARVVFISLVWVAVATIFTFGMWRNTYDSIQAMQGSLPVAKTVEVARIVLLHALIATSLSFAVIAIKYPHASR